MLPQGPFDNDLSKKASNYLPIASEERESIVRYTLKNTHFKKSFAQVLPVNGNIYFICNISRKPGAILDFFFKRLPVQF